MELFCRLVLVRRWNDACLDTDLDSRTLQDQLCNNFGVENFAPFVVVGYYHISEIGAKDGQRKLEWICVDNEKKKVATDESELGNCDFLKNRMEKSEQFVSRRLNIDWRFIYF